MVCPKEQFLSEVEIYGNQCVVKIPEKYADRANEENLSVGIGHSWCEILYCKLNPGDYFDNDSFFESFDSKLSLVLEIQGMKEDIFKGISKK